MPLSNNLFKAGMLLTATAMLPGCRFLSSGEPYPFPARDESSATIRLEHERDTYLRVMTLDEAGCYAGYSNIPYVNGSFEAPVLVNKPLVLQYERREGKMNCMINLSFTPQPGHHYTLKSGFWSESTPGLIPSFTYQQNYCGIGVLNKEGTQERIEPAKQLRITPNLKCTRFVEKN